MFMLIWSNAIIIVSREDLYIVSYKQAVVRKKKRLLSIFSNDICPLLIKMVLILVLCTTSRNVIKIDDRNNSHIESSAQGKDKRVYKIKPVTQDDTLDQNISFHRILYFLLSYFVLFFSNIIYSIFIKYIYIYICN